MSTIQVQSLMKEYGTGEARVTAVGGIDLDVQSGTLLAIMGESGSGKSTLLSMLGALNTPTSGKYKVDGVDVYSLGQEERADFRRKFLGFVFQSFHLVPYLSVRENIMLPLAPVKMKGKEKRDRAEEALRRVGLAGKSHRLPNQISGGEQERVAVARAIVNQPPILLADDEWEPRHRKPAAKSCAPPQSLNSGEYYIHGDHNPENAEFAHRVIHLKDGRINNGRVLNDFSYERKG